MFTKIIAALDTSNRSNYIFQQTIELAKHDNSSILLLHVLTSEEENSPLKLPSRIEDIYWAPGTGVDPEQWHREWQEYEQQCLGQLQVYAEQAKGQGIFVDIQQVSGSPGSTICEIAETWGADLIMLGNRGRQGVTELLMGSVSNYVLHHAHCSVLIVKPTIDYALAESNPHQERATV
ncbi:MAG: universal stress protein [Cyanobacteria bacterium P01_A01_bin.37]